MPQPDPRGKPELGELIKPKATLENGDKTYPKEAYRGITREDIEKIILMQTSWLRYQMDIETFMIKVREANK